MSNFVYILVTSFAYFLFKVAKIGLNIYCFLNKTRNTVIISITIRLILSQRSRVPLVKYGICWCHNCACELCYLENVLWKIRWHYFTIQYRDYIYRVTDISCFLWAHRNCLIWQTTQKLTSTFCILSVFFVVTVNVLLLEYFVQKLSYTKCGQIICSINCMSVHTFSFLRIVDI